MSTLPLPDISIDGFRLFRHVRIDRLGRVNLIVGRNNSGKTTLLEAIRLWASHGAPEVIKGILDSHDELKIREITDDSSAAALLSGYAQLFHGRNGRKDLPAIRIGTSQRHSEFLQIDIGFTNRRDTGSNQLDLLPLSALESVPFAQATPIFAIRFGDRRTILPIAALARRYEQRRTIQSTFRLGLGDEDANEKVDKPIPAIYVPASGLSLTQVGRLWDGIALTDLEDQVVAALRIVSPSVERISLVGELSNRTVVAKVDGIARPLPLRSMGDGVNRLLGIALALVSAKNGILLFDEVENGIHFAAQSKLWDLIFREARRLNVQVFATTHSWDCIDAFQRAASHDHHEEAVLVRFDAHDSSVRATVFDEQELQIVTRQQIEVR